MEWINEKAKTLKQGAIRAMFDRANTMTGVISLGIGEPDMPTPKLVCEACKEALDKGITHYTPNAGTLSFRQAIAEKSYLKDLHYDPNTEIIITNGGMGALSLLFLILLNKGDEILIQDPQWLNYVAQVAYCDGTAVRVPTDLKHNFEMQPETIEKLITPHTKALMINTPNNPTGVVYSAETLSRLADILTEKSKAFGHNIFLVSDEPYRDIAFDGKKVPYPAAFYPHTLTCFSFSKSLSLPGERLGYVAVRPGCEGEDVLVDMMAQISRFTGHNCPPSIIQKATAECLDVTSDLSVYETNMNLLYDKLTELGFEVERPGGTFYIFPKALEEDANAFCLKAREFDLLLVPSDTFGVKGYVRFAYCIDTEKVKRSLPALEKLAAAYKK